MDWGDFKGAAATSVTPLDADGGVDWSEPDAFVAHLLRSDDDDHDDYDDHDHNR